MADCKCEELSKEPGTSFIRDGHFIGCPVTSISVTIAPEGTNLFAKYFELDPTSRLHLTRFWKWLKRQEDPSIGVMLYNPDLYPVEKVIDLYVDWLKAGEPE